MINCPDKCVYLIITLSVFVNQHCQAIQVIRNKHCGVSAFMNGEPVLVDNVMLYYKCVTLICICTSHVYLSVIQRAHCQSVFV
jgi:hypothetical protein